MDHAAQYLPHQPGRLARLDGLRGLAACIVAFYHARLLFSAETFVGASMPVAWLHQWGWAFVDLFFVISGYIFAHVYAAPGRLSSGAALRRFALARMARLWPLHLVMLGTCAFLFAGKPGSDAAAFLAHLFMLQGFVQPFADTFDGPSWSLTIECLCYLVFAGAAFAGQRALLAVTGLSIVGGGLYLAFNAPPGGPWSNDLIPRGLLGFFVGQALWHLRARLGRVPGLALAGVGAAGFGLAAGPWSPLVPLDLLAWPALLLLGLRASLLGGRAALWLGDRSYAIYLIHMPVIELAAKRLGPVEGGAATVAAVHVVLAAIVALLADAAYRRIELPARDRIRRFGRTPAPREAMA